MSSPASARAPRRTQEQRSAATRRLILDATVRCLAEHGYGGTTTVRVVELAGVTRGALAHHFASKTDMVVAAVGHIAASRAQELLGAIERAQAADDPIEASLDLIWSLHQGPVLTAVLELWVAARTEPDLGRRVKIMEQSTSGSVIEFTRRLFGRGNDPAILHAVYTAGDAVRGIMLGKLALPGSDAEYDARWRRAKADLRVLFEHVLAQPPAS